MSNNDNMLQLVYEVKSAFNDYFTMTGSKHFKQFYYDWHVDNMLAPFAGMAEYFAINYQEKAPAAFHEFVEDFAARIDSYNPDKPQLSPLSGKKYSVTKDGRLNSLLNGAHTFGFEFRQFVYSFGTKEDHHAEFGYWPVKANMPYSGMHGLMVAKDLLRFLDKNFEHINNSSDTYAAALNAADNFLRQTITKNYAYNNKYNFTNRKNSIKKLHDLRNHLSRAYNNMPHNNPELNDMFQVEQPSQPVKTAYWPNGFELEFYVPEQFSNYQVLADYLKQQNGWQKLYFSNKDAEVYNDMNSAGVIMRDESLAHYDKLFPVEFASRVMRSPEDEKSCLKILDAFDQGHVNKHCSLHQHLSAQGFDMDTYKRLVKRIMQHEDEIVSAFAAPERRDNNLLYATYISRNLSSQSHRDYPFLALMVDMCNTKSELEEMASFGNKYKTLNIMPKHTVEMRSMNANFNKRFVEAYLQFNREFVASAAANNPHHVNRFLLNKYTWHNNETSDNKTVMHELKYGYDFVPHDSYRPMKRSVSPQLAQEEQNYARVVAHALEFTKKLRYYNPCQNKKMREVMNHGR